MFINLLNKFRLKEILEISSSLSKELINHQTPTATVNKFNQSDFIIGAYDHAGHMVLAPWYLADLSYYAIKYSHDFKEAVITESIFWELYHQFLKYDENLTMSSLEILPEGSSIFYILFGLTQKTFWQQETHRLVDMNKRFMEILHNIPKRTNTEYQYYEHIEKKYRISFYDYNYAAMLFWYFATRDTYFNPHSLNYNNLERKAITVDLINTISNGYMANYNEIRNSTLKTLQFHLTPIIQTTDSRSLFINTFIVAKKAYTDIYWETRRLYFLKTGSELNQKLGETFEIYVDDLLNHYLPNGKYRRLKRKQKARQADILIETSKYSVIIEQKFSMLNVALQDTYFSIESADRWLKSYINAAKQLSDTEEFLKGYSKTTIKLILFFDSVFMPDSVVKPRIISLINEKNIDGINLNNLFMIGIEEFEQLISMLSINEAQFDLLISDKIKREADTTNSQGIEFSQLLNALDDKPPKYINSEKFTIKDAQ